MYGVAGHSFVGLVEFGRPLKAQSLMVFGANSDPDSPNYFDQSRLFAKQQYKSAWFTPAEVNRNTKRETTLSYASSSNDPCCAEH